MIHAIVSIVVILVVAALLAAWIHPLLILVALLALIPTARLLRGY